MITALDPAATTASAVASSWKYISQLVVTPKPRSSTAARVIPQKTSAGSRWASRGHSTSSSHRISGRFSPVPRNRVIGEWQWTFTNPGRIAPSTRISAYAGPAVGPQGRRCPHPQHGVARHLDGPGAVGVRRAVTRHHGVGHVADHTGVGFRPGSGARGPAGRPAGWRGRPSAHCRSGTQPDPESRAVTRTLRRASGRVPPSAAFPVPEVPAAVGTLTDSRHCRADRRIGPWRHRTDSGRAWPGGHSRSRLRRTFPTATI